MYVRRMFIAICLLGIAANALADRATISAGRYSLISTKATPSQSDLFAVIIKTDFPLTVTTVGAAIQNLLLNSGYRLAKASHTDPYMHVLMDAQLPEVQRDLGPISLRNALTVLAGKPWRLVVDPVHRLVSFDLKKSYRRK